MTYTRSCMWRVALKCCSTCVEFLFRVSRSSTFPRSFGFYFLQHESRLCGIISFQPQFLGPVKQGLVVQSERVSSGRCQFGLFQTCLQTFQENSIVVDPYPSRIADGLILIQLQSFLSMGFGLVDKIRVILYLNFINCY